MSAELQVLLVSAQAAPNLLAALDPVLKPRQAILLVTRKMQSRAAALQAVLIEGGVKTTRVDIEDEHDFGRLESALLNVAEQHDGADIALNLTGGTKLMALAAQSVAEAAHWKTFYVDVDTDEVIWLGRNPLPRQKLTAHLRLAHYLRGYGYRPAGGVERPLPNQWHAQLLDTLVRQIGSLEKGVAALNYLAQQAESGNVLKLTLDKQQGGNPHLQAVLALFEQARVLRATGNAIEFGSADERDFAKGGWLEHHVYHSVACVGGKLDVRDKAQNLAVEDAGGVKNEMDVAFMARNRLYVIECKTARMDSPDRAKANDTLYKLHEVCSRVGGLGTKGMLASYRTVGDSERKLASALNIELVCGTELGRLPERITRWVASSGR